jgi:squalene-hopene/tetraprenyl-beta-curcumene cyclase
MRFSLTRRAFVGGAALVVAQQCLGPHKAWALAPNKAQLNKAVTRAIEFLNQAQDDDGAFTPGIGPGITALVATAVLRHGRSATDPLVAKSLKYLESFVQSSGGVHAQRSRLPNYETCLAVVCFREANADGRYDDLLAQADGYLKGVQRGGSDGLNESDTAYGGAGYGGDGRPDLSNTHYLVEALRATGNEADSEAVQKALVFVSRCQNLESEHNTTPSAALVNDGGFYYSPVGDGESPAGKTANGGLRSYGAMSYAGLKSMLFAGVGAEDPRVKAAFDWIRQHYDVDSNPGLGQAGLYYYYHLFAKALDAIGEDTLVDADGREHDWRKELVAALARRQRDNGSWINEDEHWMEGDPNLCTGFALLALSYCRAEE